MRILLLCILFLLPFGTYAENAVVRTPEGVVVTIPKKGPASVKKVRIQVMNEKVIRVSATPNDFFSKAQSLVVLPQNVKTDFNVENKKTSVVVSTSQISAIVDTSTGLVSFTDKQGKPILEEDKSGVSFKKIKVEGTDGYTVRDVFKTDDQEALYGLGQHQADEFNYKGKNEELFQYNTKVSVPFVISTKNYGILWDCYSLMRFGDKRPYSQLNRIFKLYDKDGKPGALTGTYVPDSKSGKKTFVRREDSLYFENLKTTPNLPRKEVSLAGAKVTYEGDLVAPETGAYHFILYYAGYMKLYVNNELKVAERWRTSWNPNSYKFVLNMQAGKKVRIRLEWIPDGGDSYCGLRALSPVAPEEQNKLAMWAEMEEQLDYYFIAGKSMDEVISGYRTLTGKAQVMPKWAMGFWQSRDKYSSQNEILTTFKEFRKRQMPIDNIVQDWSYWKTDSWGDQEFDRSRYPDPKAMLDSIHAMNGHLMISVWPKFYPTTDNYKALDAKGYIYRQAIKDGFRDWIYPGYLGTFYDPYSKEARTMFWNQINKGLYSKGIDAWWMDASEPDIISNADIDYRKKLCGPTAMGPSTKYFNTYALMNAQAIYEGQRMVNPNARVFLLTRSGFAGLQRYSTATWSGDIGSRWEDMKAQISAGLNYALSGVPYWTMDIGGYCTEDRYGAGQNEFEKTGIENEDLKEWRELNVRWHQFGALAPLYRSHGKFPYREIWNVAPEDHPAYKAIMDCAKLRYRLMPYIYTLSGMTHFNDYTIMRALAMDFEKDSQVYNISDQYMFGPSLMVCPVYQYKARTRTVYFPQSEGWYDFYTGKYLEGGREIVYDAPYERMPLFVKAGSILPVGPNIQSTAESKGDDLTLYVYRGADGSFTLYEDEGINYNYEKGRYSMIPIHYNENNGQLVIGARQGEFDGMLKERDIKIIAVGQNHAVPFGEENQVKTIHYAGNELTVNL